MLFLTQSSVPARSQDTLVELQLMHHFCTVTSQQYFMANHDQGIKDIYIRLAPALALKHQCLMNGLLAVAALHLYKLDPEKIAFRELNRKYFNAAVADQRQAVAILNPDNADALCISASFIAVQALAIPQETSHYSPPSSWIDLVTGHTALFTSAWTWINESNRIMALVNAEPNIQRWRDKCWQQYPAAFPANLDTVFDAILEFQDPSESLDAERISAYKWCKAYIGHTVQWIESEEDPSKIRRVLSAYGATSPPIYKSAIRERQPRALVILAHYFAIIKAVDRVWWLRGIPEREVFGIQSILPERWHWAMAWPIQKLSFYAAAAIPPRNVMNNVNS